MDPTFELKFSSGYPLPFGTSYSSDGINFALVSPKATLYLHLFDSKAKRLKTIKLDPEINRTGNVWHINIIGLPLDSLYAYTINNNSVLLQDPYAKCLFSPRRWGDLNHPLYSKLSYAYPPPAFDWEDDEPPLIPKHKLVIYEMHVRGYTQDPSSHVIHRGSYLGLIEKIPHLKALGINAIELLPVQEFDELEYRKFNPVTQERLKNYWGYSTINFFSPMNRYASNEKQGTALFEFKTMVKALHKENIEIILDIVFNHTGEGNENGPVFHFKDLDPALYYLQDKNNQFHNFSGCGNTLSCNHPIVRELIINVLRYWVLEMHVDGFRFDLASILTRDQQGNPLVNPPLIEAITADPILARTKLIAEAWDAAGLYQVGCFYPQTARWSDWNGPYRDTVRRFLKGSPGLKGEFATRLCGSQDLYFQRTPLCSLNFVTAHDGFTLADLVSYNHKHNLENGEDDQDGTSFNDSWNCGIEGETGDLVIQSLRERQMRNFHLTLMVSQGLPMIHMGDEYAHTKNGNNNTWCQDNALNWFQWDSIKKRNDFFRFYRMMIHFRLNNPLLMRVDFLEEKDIQWHGVKLNSPEWEKQEAILAFTLIDHTKGEDLYIAFNASDEDVIIELPAATEKKGWHWIVNTAQTPPNDFFDSAPPAILEDTLHKMTNHSALLLKAHLKTQLVP